VKTPEEHLIKNLSKKISVKKLVPSDGTQRDEHFNMFLRNFFTIRLLFLLVRL